MHIQRARAKRPQMVMRLNVFHVTVILYFKTCLFELYVEQLYIRFHLIRKHDKNFSLFVVWKSFFVFAMELSKWVRDFLQENSLANSKTTTFGWLFWSSAKLIMNGDAERSVTFIYGTTVAVYMFFSRERTNFQPTIFLSLLLYVWCIGRLHGRFYSC